MKTLVFDSKTFSKPQWEQDISFELEKARREAMPHSNAYCSECELYPHAKDCSKRGAK